MAARNKIQIQLEELHSGQQRVIDEALRFNVLECGRRFGKTTLGIDLLIQGAGGHNPGWPVAWFAPTYKLLAEAWRELLWRLQPFNPKVNQTEKRLELLTGGVIDCWSLDQADAGRGRKYKRVVIDEAGIVRNLQEAWQQAIRPTLTDLKGDAWFLGTPKGRGYFNRLFAKGQAGDEGWISWRLPTSDNPRISREEIEAARREYEAAGVPQVFDQEFLGIPADDGGNPFGLAAIKSCEAPLSKRSPAVFGIDLAKSVDFTVVCGLDDAGAVCVLERWQSDWKQTVRRIIDLIGDTRAVVDSTGVGDAVTEYLSPCKALRGFKFSASSKQELMADLAAAIQQQRVRFPSGWLMNELETFEYNYSASGVKYSAPEGLHDDGVCALALAVHCQRNNRPVQVIGGNVIRCGMR